MGILADFEDRIAGAIEGLFAGAFRSPVQPVEIAKALARAADDARSLGVGTVYAPTRYTVALSPEDAANLGSFSSTLAGELATYLVDHARERGYHLTSRPTVTFTTARDLALGRFRVSAAFADAEEPQQRPAVAEGRRSVARPTAPAAAPPASTRPPGPAAEATLTISGGGPDVVLEGDEVLVGRVAECDIRLSDANVSRRHAAFVRLDDGWAIVDLGSTNGTRLNGTLVQRARLHDGDVVEIGLTRFTFHEGPPAGAPGMRSSHDRRR